MLTNNSWPFKTAFSFLYIFLVLINYVNYDIMKRKNRYTFSKYVLECGFQHWVRSQATVNNNVRVVRFYHFPNNVNLY